MQALRALTAASTGDVAAIEACSTVNPDLMFPDIAYDDRNEDMPNDAPEARAAKDVCLGCPVRDLCLEYAVAKRERWGIWGGMTYREREALRRRLSRRAMTRRRRAALAAAAPVLAAAPRSSRLHAWAEQLGLFEVGA